MIWVVSPLVKLIEKSITNGNNIRKRSEDIHCKNVRERENF